MNEDILEKQRAYQKSRYDKDPDYYKKKNSSYRLAHPDNWLKCMARCYLRRLTWEKRNEVIEELKKEELK